MDPVLYNKIVSIGIYGSAIGLILIGLYAVLVKKHLTKIVIGLSIIDSGIHLLFIAVGFIKGGTAPIFSPKGIELVNQGTAMVDPVPQALVLTAIVIGLGVTALMLAYAMKLHQEKKSLDIESFKDLKW